MKTLSCSVKVFSLYVLLWCGKLGEAGAGVYEYEYFDAFDEVLTKLKSFKIDNCVESDEANFFLSDDSLTHRPDMSDAIINPVAQNRTAMLQLYNIAISRAFFWSYILQSRLIRPVIKKTYDPGMMYYLLSSVADIASNPHINASSMYFSPDKFYTPSYKGFFNQTLPRFAPRAYKSDYLNGFVDSHALVVEDLGAFHFDESSKDYTSQLYRSNEWYKLWLPDTDDNGFITKTAYQVEIRHENNTNEIFDFFGLPGMDENPGPVKWTRPYYDCERLNNWLVGAVSPVADLYPRHTNIKDIEKPTYSAAVVMEMDYELIDINQCPPGSGNPLPNHFASTAKCNETTELCVPIPGWGFNRGGYQCRCVPGYRPIKSHSGNQHNNESESDNKFECVKIELPLPLPFYSKRAHPVNYRAANIKDGYWTSPYYDCDGPLKQWVLTYAVPFFGWDSMKVKLEFKGVVAVTVSLESLDINQCPDTSSVPNAFKGTDKCDKETSYCVHVPGYGYDDSGYKCECLTGYEYPYDEPKSYYDGVRMETEFKKIVSNDLTLFDKLTCRPVNNSKNSTSNLHRM